MKLFGQLSKIFEAKSEMMVAQLVHQQLVLSVCTEVIAICRQGFALRCAFLLVPVPRAFSAFEACCWVNERLVEGDRG